jgi:hypothetical protein
VFGEFLDKDKVPENMANFVIKNSKVIGIPGTRETSKGYHYKGYIYDIDFTCKLLRELQD